MIPQSLFNLISLNIAKPLKLEMSTAEKACGLSRDQIADRMNDLADQYGIKLKRGNGRLTVDTLEKWLNVKDMSRVINIKALVIFCTVVECTNPLQVLVKPLGGMVIDKNMQRYCNGPSNTTGPKMPDRP